MKTAILIGSTGLVGQQLLHQLLANNYYEKVISFSRRPSGITHNKLVEHLVDFNKIDDWQHLIKGDHLYSAMGTTLKKAGSKERQYSIDFTYQYNTAKAAKNNGSTGYALVSSAGANSKSAFFYNRIKGELEDAILKLNFNHICIVQPSVLKGNRQELRPAEKMSIGLLDFFNKIGLFKKYRPAKANMVAKTMIKNLTQTHNSKSNTLNVLTLNEVLDYV